MIDRRGVARQEPERALGAHLLPARSRDWWEQRTLAGNPDRSGSRANRFTLLELDGPPAAYAISLHAPHWDADVSSGKVVVIEAIGVAPAAVAELWRFLLDIDCVAATATSLVPPDHPLSARGARAACQFPIA